MDQETGPCEDGASELEANHPDKSEDTIDEKENDESSGIQGAGTG